MKKILLTFICSIATMVILNAQLVTWDGGAGTTNWMDADNWDTNALPGTMDSVLIDLTGSTVDLAGTTTVVKVEVKNDCTLNVMASGNLTCDGASTDDGLETSPSGIIVNNGTISIETSATNEIDALYTKGTFTNNGTITITGAGEHGVRMAGGSFVNNVGGTINVTGVGTGDSGGDGFYLDDDSGTPCLVTNNGIITVTMTSGDDGVYLKDKSEFINSGDLTIDGSSGNDMGLHLVGASTKFTNMASGFVTVINNKDYGVQIDGANVTPACSIDNAGSFNINGGSNNGGSNDGLRIRRGGYMVNTGTATFNSTGDDSIQINDSSVGGTEHTASTFDNFGTVDIIGSTDHGMELFGFFNNKAGATFKADGCADDGIRISASGGFGIFMNDGSIQIDNSVSDDIDLVDPSSMVNSSTATFAPGLNTGDLVVRDGLNFGPSVITFEINGTSSANDEYDQVRTKGSTLTDMTLATAKLVWGYTPSPGDCFKIVDGDANLNFTAAGAFAGFDDTQNPSINYVVDYFSGAGKEVLICVVPENNDCTSASQLAADSPATLTGQSFEGATSSGPAESCDGDTAPSSTAQLDLWYQVNTDSDGGDLTIEVMPGSGSDVVIALYDGCGGTQLTCADASGDAGMESITFTDPAFTGKGASSSTRSDLDYWVRLYEKTESGSDFTISATGTALPVELLSFSAHKTTQGAELNWQTANEINNESFDIQRSSNSSDWITIDNVRGSSNSNKLIEYVYIDRSPLEKTNYYRLKQKDLDGKFEYSSIVLVDFRYEKRAVSIYPNPVKDVLNIDMDTEIENGEIQLYDSNGMTLWKGNGAATQIPFDQYSPGIYFLEIVSPLNRTIQKIVK